MVVTGETIVGGEGGWKSRLSGKASRVLPLFPAGGVLSAYGHKDHWRYYTAGIGLHPNNKFLFDLGASIGKPTLTLSASGAQNNATLQADLNAERNDAQEDLDKYLKVYPVLSFGLAYPF